MSTSAEQAKSKRGRPSEADIMARAGFNTEAPEPVERRGGARSNAGRKSAAIEAGSADAHILYAKAKAKKMAFDAQMAELDFKVKSGEYTSRDEVKQAAATSMATIAQTMRSIPDNLERRLGVSPDLAEEIGLLIDECLNDLANELERMHGA